MSYVRGWSRPFHIMIIVFEAVIVQVNYYYISTEYCYHSFSFLLIQTINYIFQHAFLSIMNSMSNVYMFFHCFWSLVVSTHVFYDDIDNSIGNVLVWKNSFVKPEKISFPSPTLLLISALIFFEEKGQREGKTMDEIETYRVVFHKIKTKIWQFIFKAKLNIQNSSHNP